MLTLLQSMRICLTSRVCGRLSFSGGCYLPESIALILEPPEKNLRDPSMPSCRQHITSLSTLRALQRGAVFRLQSSMTIKNACVCEKSTSGGM